MKRKWPIILILTIFLGLVAYVFAKHLYLSSDISTNFYTDIESVISDGAIKRGWIPKDIPLSAKNIHEQHNLDTNLVFIRFEINQKEWEQITKKLQKLTPSEIENIDNTYPYDVDWWFECLIEKCPSNDGGLYSEIFHGIFEQRHGKAYLAKDKFKDIVYFWNVYN